MPLRLPLLFLGLYLCIWNVKCDALACNKQGYETHWWTLVRAQEPLLVLRPTFPCLSLLLSDSLPVSLLVCMYVCLLVCLSVGRSWCVCCVCDFFCFLWLCLCMCPCMCVCMSVCVCAYVWSIRGEQVVRRYKNEEGKELTGGMTHIDSDNLMDQWIQAAAAGLLQFVNTEMKAYRLYTVVPRLLRFVRLAPSFLPLSYVCHDAFIHVP